MIFFTAHLSPSRYQVQIEAERSLRLIALDEAIGRVMRRPELENELEVGPKSISWRCLRFL